MKGTAFIRSLGSFLVAIAGAFGAIAACRSAVQSPASPGDPWRAISRPCSRLVQFVLGRGSALAKPVQNPAQNDVFPLRLKVPGFIIVRPFLHEINSIGTAYFLRADGPIAASTRRRTLSLAHGLSGHTPAVLPWLFCSRSGLFCSGSRALPRRRAAGVAGRVTGARVRGPPAFLSINPIFTCGKEHHHARLKKEKTGSRRTRPPRESAPERSNSSGLPSEPAHCWCRFMRFYRTGWDSGTFRGSQYPVSARFSHIQQRNGGKWSQPRPVNPGLRYGANFATGLHGRDRPAGSCARHWRLRRRRSPRLGASQPGPGSGPALRRWRNWWRFRSRRGSAYRASSFVLGRGCIHVRLSPLGGQSRANGIARPGLSTQTQTWRNHEPSANPALDQRAF